jgi:hypothetical protein
LKPLRNKTLPQRSRISQSQSASRHSSPSVHIKNQSSKKTASNQRNTNYISSRTLDQLAVVAAILSLIAAAIGLYIAWKSLSIPDETAVVV